MSDPNAASVAPDDRGCRWCQAMPGEFCEEDCGGPAPVLHPDVDEQASDSNEAGEPRD